MIRLIIEGQHPVEGGSVTLFLAHEENGTPHTVGVDWRPARDIISALEAGERVEVDVERWQILGRDSA